MATITRKKIYRRNPPPSRKRTISEQLAGIVSVRKDAAIHYVYEKNGYWYVGEFKWPPQL